LSKNCPYCNKEIFHNKFCPSCNKPVVENSKPYKPWIPGSKKESPPASALKDSSVPVSKQAGLSDAEYSSYETRSSVPPKSPGDISTYDEVKDILSRQEEIQKKRKKVNNTILIVICLVLGFFVMKFVFTRIALTCISEGCKFIRTGFIMLGRTNTGDAEPGFDKAMEYFDKAIAWDSSLSEPYCLKGVLYYLKYYCSGNTRRDYLEEMFLCLNKAVSLRPSYPEAYVYLSVYYYEKKQYDTSIYYLEKAENLPSKSWTRNSEKKKNEWLNFIKISKDNMKKGDYKMAFPPVPGTGSI